MALDFPDTPTVGDTYGTWKWDGLRWVANTSVGGPRGRVAYAEVKASQSNTFVAMTDLTGMSVAWVADPTRTYKTTVHVIPSSTVNGDQVTAYLRDAAGVYKQIAATPVLNAQTSSSLTITNVESGLSGSINRKVSALRSGGSGTITFAGDPGYPMFILVEDITYEAAGTAGASGGGTETSAWIVATMGSGWAHYTSGRSQTAYRKIGDEVQLRVSASGGGTAAVGSTMFTLPDGYRPPGVLDIWGRDGGSTGIAVLYNITAGGLVQWYGSTPANNANLCCFICQYSVTP
jgi:hypothetical protein